MAVFDQVFEEIEDLRGDGNQLFPICEPINAHQDEINVRGRLTQRFVSQKISVSEDDAAG